jgi:hypothetical protein
VSENFLLKSLNYNFRHGFFDFNLNAKHGLAMIATRAESYAENDT